MGGCASRPKDLDFNEPAPVPVEQVESQTIAQEINGGEETKTEEPLVDISEPTEANETAEEKPAEKIAEIKAEEIPLLVEEAKEVEPEIIEDKADAPLAPIA